MPVKSRAEGHASPKKGHSPSLQKGVRVFFCFPIIRKEVEPQEPEKKLKNCKMQRSLPEVGRGFSLRGTVFSLERGCRDEFRILGGTPQLLLLPHCSLRIRFSDDGGAQRLQRLRGAEGCSVNCNCMHTFTCTDLLHLLHLLHLSQQLHAMIASPALKKKRRSPKATRKPKSQQLQGQLVGLNEFASEVEGCGC